MVYLIVAICALVMVVAVKSIKGKTETPESSPAVSPGPVPTDPELFFRLVMDEAAASLFKKFGEPNPDYSLSKSELVDLGYIESRVFKYYEIEGVPEIEADQVFFYGVPVGRLKRNDKKEALELIASGCPFSLGIYGGEYKYISAEYDEERDREVYDLERGEAPVAATLRIKKGA